jgi:hypothetical protein
MTEEEREKLCEWLRGASVGWSGSSMIEPKMAQAANEIERLAGTDPRFTVTEIEGKCYVQVRNTDFVVAEFDLPLKVNQ